MRLRGRRPGDPTRATAALGVLTVAWLASGCSPELNWRVAHLEGSGATMTFPCRPHRKERTVRLGAAALPAQLHSCRADDATFSLLAVDADDPAHVTPLLEDLRRQAIANLAGTARAEPLP
ncbi:MAG: hypothetical protein ABI364_01210, partial [Caldimonas sp.]